MELTTKQIAKLAKNLKAFYMGELVPPAEAIIGYYDAEVWEVADPCTMYKEGHHCIECDVEYIHNPGKSPFLGENTLAAHITLYIEGGHFCRQTEYWDARHVAMFTNEIEFSI